MPSPRLGGSTEWRASWRLMCTPILRRWDVLARAVHPAADAERFAWFVKSALYTTIGEPEAPAGMLRAVYAGPGARRVPTRNPAIIRAKSSAWCLSPLPRPRRARAAQDAAVAVATVADG